MADMPADPPVERVGPGASGSAGRDPRSLARGAALQAMKRVAAASDRVRRPVDGIVVLIYHRVGARAATEIDLPAATFDRQMAFLAASGRAVSLDAAVEQLSVASADGGVDPEGGEVGRAAGGEAFPVGDKPPVVVTFDDGTSDLAEVALPILARHGVPATVYLGTQFVEEQRPWPADGAPLTWEQAREMRDSGLVGFGSHTHSHVLLDRLAPAAAAEELDRSRGLIEERLQVRAEHFAYPKAVAPSAEVAALVRERFRSAALGGNRPNPLRGADLYRLSRTAVQVSDGWGFFQRKADGGMALEDDFRRAANKVRYRRSAG